MKSFDTNYYGVPYNVVQELVEFDQTISYCPVLGKLGGCSMG